MSDLWNQCIQKLEHEIPPQDFNTWIRPLQAVENNSELHLLAPNQFVLDWVREHFIDRIESALPRNGNGGLRLVMGVGTRRESQNRAEESDGNRKHLRRKPDSGGNLNPASTFDTFVEGKSNQFAKAAAIHVVENLGQAYNPLFIYGGVGLGKTHLMHAIGNAICHRTPDAQVVYLHSERFVSDMVTALQHNAIDTFKELYRSVDTLLVDDIQFFAGKERSQEEFFHTFNTLLENKHQVVLTCDRYPKEIEGLEERLKSRFGWGLSVAIEPPDLETRVAILMKKAQQWGVELPEQVAFFIGKRIRSNVRELEGALRRVTARAQFTGEPITLPFAKEALRDLIVIHDKQIRVENIQKTVAEYYKIRVTDLLSNKRARIIARPRQIAMALTKELTTHSLPQIGRLFGGRDHTTVLHACRTIEKLRKTDRKLAEDYTTLLHLLTN